MIQIIVTLVLLVFVIVGLVGNGDDDGIDDYMYYNGHKYYRKK